VEIVARATLAFFFVFLLLRGMKRKTLSDLSPLELILLVVLGDLVQTGVTQEDYSMSGLVLSVSTFAFWVTVMNWLTWRSDHVRRAIEGVPLVVIDDGMPVLETLKVEQIPLAELYEAARQQGIDDLQKVRLGVLEVSGRISFIKR
jgi:uncharacterized membrane protein YcaP (DUF421 family)